MGIQLVLGSSGAGKSHWLYEKMINDSMQNAQTNYLIIVPEQFTLQTQKDIVSMHPNQGVMNIDILSFMRLTYHVFDEVGGNHRLVLEDTGKSMIVKKVAMDKRSELVVFGANVKKQGFIDEMKSMISELLQYSIHREKLEQMMEVAENRKLLSNKLKDISTIYGAYKDFLRDKYINAEELLDVLCEVIDDSKMIQNSVICLDGFTGFTPSQYNLLAHLMKRAKMVYVTLTMDAREVNKRIKEHELFYLSGRTMEKLYHLADENHIEIHEPVVFTGPIYRFHNSEPLQALEHNLFRYPYERYDKEQSDITILEAKSAKEEVSYVVVEIRRLLQNENYRYKDIAIVTGDIVIYGKLMKQQCGMANIPCFIDNKKSIITNPVVEMIRSVIELAEQNFSYDGVVRFLKCGLLPYDKTQIEHFENYLLAQGIRGFSMFKTEWTLSYRTNYLINLEEINNTRNRLVTDLTDVYEKLTNKELNVREKITAIYELMVYFQVEQQLLAMADAFRASTSEEDRQRVKEYDQVYRMILEIFDRMVELLGEDVLPLKEVKDILETGLKEAKVGLIPPGVDQILIGDIERTRLKDIKALFFLGINDGIVPKANPGGGILSDVERQLFADNDIELSPTKQQNAFLTEFYLYLNLTKPQNRLYLSYARVDESGKAIRPSYLISKIVKLFPKITIFTTQHIQEVKDKQMDAMLGTDFGMTYLINQLRDYDQKKDNTLFYELYHCYLNGEIPSSLSLEHILEGVFYQNKESRLTQKVSQKLYGEVLAGSVTRMERYAVCAFAHFLEYGLALEERREFMVSVPDIGNIFHEALELFSKKVKESDYTWYNLPKEVEIEYGKSSVVEAVTDYGNGVLTSSKRNSYMITRVERILLKTVETLVHQLKKGKFEPTMYEQFFSHADRFLSLHGRIDRMDVYEEENKLYVKIIDYKSGSTSFDLVSLYYGLQLQLGVYLSAALSMMKEKNPNKEIIPAGVFYYNLDDPIVEKTDHVDTDIARKLRMNGLVTKENHIVASLDSSFYAANGGLNPSVKSDVIPVETGKEGDITKRSSVASLAQIEKLQHFITDLMHQFSMEIMEGVVSHNPYKQKQKEACSYCKYQTVCGFDCKLDGFAYRRLKSMSAQEVWEQIEGGESKDGDEDVDTTATEGN